MVNREDWDAAMSSEIFREYVKQETIKESQLKPEPVINEDQALAELQEFETKIRENPQLKEAFLKLKFKFANDPAYRQKVDPKFVEGVMLLDLTPDEE